MRVKSSGLQVTVVLCVAAALVSGFVSACGSSPVSPSALTGSANLTLMLTDAPIDDVVAVNVAMRITMAR